MSRHIAVACIGLILAIPACGDDDPSSTGSGGAGGESPSTTTGATSGTTSGSSTTSAATTTGATTGGATTTGSGGSGGGGDGGGDGGGGGGGSVWPDPAGPENGSAWLRENHAALTHIEPRVLVLDVVQRDGLSTIEDLVSDLVDAFGAMSQHRSTLDPDAEVFVRYQVDKIVDMRDPGGAEYPAFWPPATADGFDVGALFTDEFAPRLGYPDPDVEGRSLTMCELFERGIINELWIAAEGNRNIYENQSRLQVYGEDLEPVSGEFDGCTNGCFHDPLSRVDCSVTVRMQEINKSRGVGCGTHAAGHALEHLRFTIPYLRDNATRFFGFDLDTRHGLSEDSLYACPYDAGDCVDFPSPGTMVSSTLWPGDAFSIDDWGAGCGNIHFAPNSRGHYDYYSDLPALSSCDGYMRGEGRGGADLTNVHAWSTVEELDALHGDCGGGWVVYWGQSWPGLGNAAIDVSGGPMRNWWPFVFY